MLGWITTIGAALKGIGALKDFITWKENRELKDAGAAQEREKRNEEERNVKERMDNVERPNSNDVANSLRDHEY